MYIHVPSDGTYLTEPVSGITRVELVSATLPLSVPNIWDGDILVIRGQTINVPQGYYSQISLLGFINDWKIPDLLAFLRPENNNPQLVSSSPFFLTGSSSNVLSVLGMTSDQEPIFIPYDINPQVTNKWVITGQNIDSQGLKQIFLYIEEFTHPFMNGFFATFPVDTPQYAYKWFRESRDCQCAINFPKPLDKIHRITPKWMDQNRNVLDVQGNFLLKVYYNGEPKDPVPVRGFKKQI